MADSPAQRQHNRPPWSTRIRARETASENRMASLPPPGYHTPPAGKSRQLPDAYRTQTAVSRDSEHTLPSRTPGKPTPIVLSAPVPRYPQRSVPAYAMDLAHAHPTCAERAMLPYPETPSGEDLQDAADCFRQQAHQHAVWSDRTSADTCYQAAETATCPPAIGRGILSINYQEAHPGYRASASIPNGPPPSAIGTSA